MNLRTPALSPTVTEIVILAVASHFGAAYPLYAHENQARVTDLTEAQIEALKAGRKPDGLSDRGQAAYEMAKELMEKKGPLNKDRWDDAVKLFGMDGALGILHYIGVYCSVSVLVNGIDAPVPDPNWKM
jgi:4-carboxymuconolactone decarboxylase